MSLRTSNKLPKRTLVYFMIDKSTCIVDTKKLRKKDTREPFTNSAPEEKATVMIKNGSKELEAIVIALDDNKEKLNFAEDEFVDNPDNAHLFPDPPSGEKRDRQEKTDATIPAKRVKTSDDEVEMLNALIAEQTQKQARLKELRVGRAIVKTKDASVQFEPRKTVDAAVQTDFPDIMEDLKQQVSSLSKIVAELTQLKARETATPTLPALSESLISEIVNQEPPVVEQSLFVPDPPATFAVPTTHTFPSYSVSQPALVTGPSVINAVSDHPQNSFMSLLPSRSPLATIDSNAVFSSTNRGPTDQQKRKIEAIVCISTQMITSAMACVDVLFSEEELVNGNTAGSSGYGMLDSLKISYLQSVLRQKYDSDTFAKQWEDVRGKINSRCRGKRRTVLRRLQKQIDNNK